MIEQGVVSYLGAYAGLTALIGTRLYPLQLPETPTLPSVVYQTISILEEYSQSGYSSLSQVRLQFTCWGSTLLSAKNVAAQVKAAMRGYRGTMGTQTVGGTFVENVRDGLEEETALAFSMVDVILWHEE